MAVAGLALIETHRNDDRQPHHFYPTHSTPRGGASVGFHRKRMNPNSLFVSPARGAWNPLPAGQTFTQQGKGTCND